MSRFVCLLFALLSISSVVTLGQDQICFTEGGCKCDFTHQGKQIKHDCPQFTFCGLKDGNAHCYKSVGDAQICNQPDGCACFWAQDYLTDITYCPQNTMCRRYDSKWGCVTVELKEGDKCASADDCMCKAVNPVNGQAKFGLCLSQETCYNYNGEPVCYAGLQQVSKKCEARKCLCQGPKPNSSGEARWPVCWEEEECKDSGDGKLKCLPAYRRNLLQNILRI